MTEAVDAKLTTQIAEMTSLLLWENGAVKINAEEPFKLASGNRSPLYINCRQVFSDPLFMNLFNSFAAIIIDRNQIKVDMFAGGETAGIPYAAYLAHSKNLPMLYVRKKAKSYGIASKVEGGSPDGKHVMLIEDLITDGGSKIGFIEALRAGGGTVTDALVLFDRNQGGDETLKKTGVNLISVTDLATALKVAGENNILTAQDLETVYSYLKDPEQWHQQRGLEFNG